MRLPDGVERRDGEQQAVPRGEQRPTRPRPRAATSTAAPPATTRPAPAAGAARAPRAVIGLAWRTRRSRRAPRRSGVGRRQHFGKHDSPRTGGSDPRRRSGVAVAAETWCCPAWTRRRHCRAVLAACRPGYRARGRQRLHRRHRRRSRAAHGARVVHEPRRGYGAAVHAGCWRARGRFRRVPRRRRLARPGRAAGLVDAGASGAADLAVGRRRPVGRRRVAVARPGRQRADRRAAAPPRRAGARHRADPGGPPGRRCWSSASPTARSAIRWSCCCAPARPAGGSSSSTWRYAPARPAAGRRCPARCAARCAPPGTWPGCCDDRRPIAAVLIVLAKAPVPGRVKTRLCPPATPQQAAELAAAALLDTLDAVRGDARRPGRGRARRRSAAGRPRAASCGRAARSTVVAQRGDGPRRPARQRPRRHRGAAARPATPADRHGHPAGRPDAARGGAAALACAGVGRGARPGHRRRLVGARAARPAARAVLLADVPTSARTPASAPCAALRAGGLRVEPLPVLTDVDTSADAGAVAERHPGPVRGRGGRSVTASAPSTSRLGRAPGDRWCAATAARCGWTSPAGTTGAPEDALAARPLHRPDASTWAAGRAGWSPRSPRGVPALGVDISRGGGGPVPAPRVPMLRRDLFAPLPGEGRWEHVLLADGNIGIGGDPARLLRRAASCCAPAARCWSRRPGAGRAAGAARSGWAPRAARRADPVGRGRHPAR